MSEITFNLKGRPRPRQWYEVWAENQIIADLIREDGDWVLESGGILLSAELRTIADKLDELNNAGGE